MSERSEDPLMTKDEVAEYLRVSTRTVDRLPLPKTYLGPRMPRWRKSVIEAFAQDPMVAA